MKTDNRFLLLIISMFLSLGVCNSSHAVQYLSDIQRTVISQDVTISGVQTTCYHVNANTHVTVTLEHVSFTGSSFPFLLIETECELKLVGNNFVTVTNLLTNSTSEPNLGTAIRIEGAPNSRTAVSIRGPGSLTVTASGSGDKPQFSVAGIRNSGTLTIEGGATVSAVATVTGNSQSEAFGIYNTGGGASGASLIVRAGATLRIDGTTGAWHSGAAVSSAIFEEGSSVSTPTGDPAKGSGPGAITAPDDPNINVVVNESRAIGGVTYPSFTVERILPETGIQKETVKVIGTGLHYGNPSADADSIKTIRVGGFAVTGKKTSSIITGEPDTITFNLPGELTDNGTYPIEFVYYTRAVSSTSTRTKIVGHFTLVNPPVPPTAEAAPGWNSEWDHEATNVNGHTFPGQAVNYSIPIDGSGYRNVSIAGVGVLDQYVAPVQMTVAGMAKAISVNVTFQDESVGLKAAEGKAITLKAAEISAEDFGKYGGLQVIDNDNGEVIGTLELTLYDNLDETQLLFAPPTYGFAGSFALGTTGYSADLKYKVGDGPWQRYGNGLSNSEIARIAAGETLYLRDPGSPVTASYSATSSAYTSLPPTITRYVNIVVPEGITTTRSAGYTSDGMFVFDVTPVNFVDKGILHLAFSRDGIPVGNPPYVEISEPVNGIYTVTLTNIKVSNLTVTLSYSTGNGNVSDVKVWSNGAYLFVNSHYNGIAKVYDVVGKLVHTLQLYAGNSSQVKLNAGVYVVTLGDEVFKVAIQ